MQLEFSFSTKKKKKRKIKTSTFLQIHKNIFMDKYFYIKTNKWKSISHTENIFFVHFMPNQTPSKKEKQLREINANV